MSYEFLPDLQATNHHNEQYLLCDTPLGYYFNSPQNLAFHDLTTIKSLPPATKNLKGIFTKCVPVPKYQITIEDTKAAFTHFKIDLTWKVLFAGEKPFTLKINFT